MLLGRVPLTGVSLKTLLTSSIKTVSLQEVVPTGRGDNHHKGTRTVREGLFYTMYQGIRKRGTWL